MYANPTRRMVGSSPSSAAAVSDASSPAVAPSVSPAELPAVTRPPARNGVRSAARPSSVVSGRRNSSRPATRHPSSPKTLIGTTVRDITPSSSAQARVARAWLSSAYASAASRVSCGNASWRFSAVWPITAALSSISRSLKKRGLKSTSSPIAWCPMCSTPPTRTRSAAPIAISPAPAVVAVSAPAHMRSTAKPGTVWGSPASRATSRPSVKPWSPTCAVAAKITSPMRSGGTDGLRRSSSRTTLTAMSSARVFQNRPLGPALPNAVRTPSMKTTSLRSRPMSTRIARSHLTDAPACVTMVHWEAGGRRRPSFWGFSDGRAYR